MKPTKEQIQEAYNCWNNDCIDDNDIKIITSVLESALEAQPVDIESLKQFIVDETCEDKDPHNRFVQGIYAAVEVLSATGRLAGVKHLDDTNVADIPATDQDVRQALDWWINGVHYFKRSMADDTYWICGNKIFQTIRKALTRPAVPEGYALVPIEQTKKMMNAWNTHDCETPDTFSIAYKAMLAAAPKQEVE